MLYELFDNVLPWFSKNSIHVYFIFLSFLANGFGRKINNHVVYAHAETKIQLILLVALSMPPPISSSIPIECSSAFEPSTPLT